MHTLLLLLPTGGWLLGCGGVGPPRAATTAGDYLVYGRDAPGVDQRLEALATAHWDYMDRFADRLVARGPTLSPDGQEHTGSMHVLTAPDAAAARRFAEEEPYRRAGVYAEVAVIRFVNLLGCTMWDRPPAPDAAESTFLVARWTPVRADAQAQRAAEGLRGASPDLWVFLGLLVSEDGTRTVGIAGAADAPVDAARAALRDALASLGQADAPIEAHRWQRGGRPK